MIEYMYKNAHILIVDDKPSNVHLLEELLQETGYENYQSTTDSRLTVDLFKSFKPDLILLDLMMPHLNGYQVMEELKPFIPADTFLPILVLTADITQEAKQRALSNGAKDFISKPFNLLEVRLRIKNLLETRYIHLLLENQNQLLEEKVQERTAELNRANKELEVLDQAKLDFLHMISHEIRTPLNGIKGFTDLLKAEVQLPELKKYVYFLEKSTLRLERFSHKALWITKLRAEHYKLNQTEVPLVNLVREIEKKLQDKIQLKNTIILLQNNASFVSLYADWELLEICVECLIDNAIKHSPDYSIITINAFSDELGTGFEIKDEGTGFSDSALDKIFHIFGAADRHMDKNTGLSMLLVKLIMDTHHGTISITNNQTKGATVRLTFNHRR